ncbi:AAA family ATPase [Acetobacteraceae bacterium]|nr:AAA family ATPase [Acetobacteraceae bacterium]
MLMNALKAECKTLIGLNMIPMVFGEPGLGKTTIIRQIADELNLELRDIRLTQYSGIDLGGFPYVKNGIGEYAYFPKIFPFEETPCQEGKDGFLILLDELTLADNDVLKIALRILCERELGEHKIHPNCRFVAAGNKKRPGFIGRHLPHAIINRMIVLDVDYDIEDYITFCKRDPTYNPILLQALETENDLLFGFKENDEAFVSNRSLSALSKYLNNVDPPNLEVMEGIIGDKRFCKKILEKTVSEQLNFDELSEKFKKIYGKDVSYVNLSEFCKKCKIELTDFLLKKIVEKVEARPHA